jgi:hypothetical protein
MGVCEAHQKNLGGVHSRGRPRHTVRVGRGAGEAQPWLPWGVESRGRLSPREVSVSAHPLSACRTAPPWFRRPWTKVALLLRLRPRLGRRRNTSFVRKWSDDSAPVPQQGRRVFFVVRQASPRGPCASPWCMGDPLPPRLELGVETLQTEQSHCSQDRAADAIGDPGRGSRCPSAYSLQAFEATKQRDRLGGDRWPARRCNDSPIGGHV